MSVSLPKFKELTLSTIDGMGKEDFVVTKMPLGRYNEFLLEAAKIPKSISGIVKMFLGESAEGDLPEETDAFLDAMLEIPTILAKHWTEVVGLLAIASGIEKKRLEDLDLDEATMIVEAVIEVNNFFGIKDRYDKMMMRKVIAEKKQKRSMPVPSKK